MRTPTFLVVPYFKRGPHDPKSGMAPGVYGVGKQTGWIMKGFDGRGKYTSASWIFPTEQEARKELRRYQREAREP